MEIDVNEPKQRRTLIMDRIMARVRRSKETGCWEWQGPTSGDGRGGGYGRMHLDGQTVAVHIVVFCHYHGYIPGKRQVDHTCENRRCCNPAHLDLVTHLENQKRKKHRVMRDHLKGKEK
jgi:hypothetical protein